MSNVRYQLERCVWEITLACCFNCKYCGSRAGRARKNELTTEECLDVARQLAELKCGRVILIGGEVFLRNDWDIIAKELVRNGVDTSIITNGFMLDELLIKKIKDVGLDAVGVSLDGIEWIQDKYRHKGSYKRAIAAIETLRDNDIPTAIVSTLNSESSKYLLELYEVLKNYSNIYAWQIQACSPMGNADGGFNYELSHKNVIEFIASIAEVSPFRIFLGDNIGYFTKQENLLRGDLSGYTRFPGCSAGLSTLGIDSIGNVRGCESMYDESFIEGNLRNQKLRDIWEAPNAFSYNRKFVESMLTGKCSTCKYGFMCAGGCRAYNYFTHQKLYEAKYCAKNE